MVIFSYISAVTRKYRGQTSSIVRRCTGTDSCSVWETSPCPGGNRNHQDFGM